MTTSMEGVPTSIGNPSPTRAGSGRVKFIAGVIALTIAAAARADDVQSLKAVEVTGNYDNGVGTSDAASQGSVNAKLIENRPVLRPGEILEFVPGLIVSQHSGDGKANQYYLRGFNLDPSPISRPSSTACRSTCARTRTARAIPTSIS